MADSSFKSQGPLGTTNFRYEPLDLSSENASIRLVVLLAGTIESTVRITLIHKAFVERPHYEALSYMWGSPDVMKGIELNGIRAFVRENLWSALVRLRDPRQDRVLWIDAICINQENVAERNNQVRLMDYIYRRAQMVLVWLGVDGAALPIGHNFSGKRGNYVGPLSNTGVANMTMLCNRPYWRRVWIVQEIAAATELQIYWGEHCAPWDVFFRFAERCHPDQESAESRSARQLYSQRKAKHSDSFLLCNLVEDCRDSLCEEPRDKIYGFVGIAHDCQNGSLPVDYSKSLYELYQDMLRYKCNTARLMISGEHPSEECRQDIIHFSQLIQSILGGPTSMKSDFARLRPDQSAPFLPSKDIRFSNWVIARAYTVGTICKVGPTYNEIISGPFALREWNCLVDNCGLSGEELQIIRRKSECWIRTLIFDTVPYDVGRVVAINPHYGWRASPDGDSTKTNFTFDHSNPDEEHLIDEPRLYLTKAGGMGLAPGTAKVGDSLWGFSKSDVVAVLRTSNEPLKEQRIVGSAVIANEEYRQGQKFQTLHIDTNSKVSRGISTEIYIDFRTLKIMTQWEVSGSYL